MLFLRRKAILIACLFCLVEISFAQTVTVKSITYEGLKKTKPLIVSRELTFVVGDTLPQNDLGPILERNKNNLLNLGIFNEVVVNITEWDTETHTVDIIVAVEESWYIYILPIFDLADRNFNVWWTTHKASLSRINIGARLDWLNFTGRNDKLKAKIQFGYTPKQEIEYRFPYFNKKQSVGLSTGFLHSINKELNYATTNNKEEFISFDERVVYERWEGRASVFYRPNIFLKYEAGLNYQHRTVDNRIVTDYNPQYFITGDSTQSVFGLSLAFEYDDRDLKIFAERGVKIGLGLDKVGLGFTEEEDLLITNAVFELNIPSGRRFQHRFSALGKYSFSRNLPSYSYYRGLGYGVYYVSGYELYLVNGLDAVLGKYQLAYKLFERKTELGKFMPIPQFRTMPYTIYLSVLAETGYVNDPFTGDVNSLGNRWLYGGGPAISILMYNNFFFQFSYAGNHLGEWGLYIHSSTSF